MSPAPPDALYSARHMTFFNHVFTGFARRHMRALRLARWGMPEHDPARPLVVFANHPSWWDGIAFMLLAQRLFPGRRMFIPMQAQALGRYGFMRRIGVFGVDHDSPRGAIGFLRIAEALLRQPAAHMLWMNAPGRFVDARLRPVPIAAGLVRLAELAPEARFLPLALEYPFWSERRAEMLAAFGEPIEGRALLALTRAERAVHLADALAKTLDRLAQDAIARDPARFQVVEQGREGMGGFYDLWRRLRAWGTGQRFDPRHEADGPGA